MLTGFGLLLALVCIAIVALGIALSVVSWQPRGSDVPFTAGIAVGCGCVVLACLHLLAAHLT